MPVLYDELRDLWDEKPQPLLKRIEGAIVDKAWDVLTVEADTPGPNYTARKAWAQKVINEDLGTDKASVAETMMYRMLWALLIDNKGAANVQAIRDADDPTVLTAITKYVDKVMGAPS
jgi:hypothetical protein